MDDVERRQKAKGWFEDLTRELLALSGAEVVFGEITQELQDKIVQDLLNSHSPFKSTNFLFVENDN